MRTLNRVQLSGFVGRAELRDLPNSRSCILRFSVATDYVHNAGGSIVTDTDWTTCVLWNKKGISERITKGTRVYVEGPLRTRKWEQDGQKHYVTEVIVEQVILLEFKPLQNGGRPEAAAPSANAHGYIPQEDDVPF